jgi:hypothetical protein
MGHLGLGFMWLTPNRVVATMPVGGRHHRTFGYLDFSPDRAASGAGIDASRVRRSA